MPPALNVRSRTQGSATFVRRQQPSARWCLPRDSSAPDVESLSGATAIDFAPTPGLAEHVGPLVAPLGSETLLSHSISLAMSRITRMSPMVPSGPRLPLCEPAAVADGRRSTRASVRRHISPRGTEVAGGPPIPVHPHSAADGFQPLREGPPARLGVVELGCSGARPDRLGRVSPRPLRSGCAPDNGRSPSPPRRGRSVAAGVRKLPRLGQRAPVEGEPTHRR